MTSDGFGFKMYAYRDLPWGAGISINFGVKTQDGITRVAQPITLKDQPRGSVIEPMIRLTIEEAQSLMDSLWDCGLRPTEGTGSAGSMAAAQKHLEDMRQLAFSALKVAKP